MELAEKMKYARLALGITQKDLARMCGLSEQSIVKYEARGAIPRKKNLEKIANALHVSVDYLSSPSNTDPGSAFEKKAFIREAEAKFGKKAGKQAADILEQANALFAGGSLSEDAKDLFMQSLMDTFIQSKEASREKFSSKKIPKVVKKRNEDLLGDNQIQSSDE